MATNGTIASGSISVIAGTVASVGTIPGVGTITNIGSISSIGTMPAISVGNSTGGTLDLLKAGTVVISGGTINAGTVTTSVQVGTINAGTIDLMKAGTISMINAGTLTNSGTTTGVGVVSMLSAGTVSMINAGTISSVGSAVGVGVVSNLTIGSVRMTIGTLTSGSLTNLGQIYNAGTVQNQLGGTITTVLNAGTTQNLLGGTINTVLNAGTNSARNMETVLTYWGNFAATAAAYGTIVGSASVGAGTAIYVQNAHIINPYGTVLNVMGFGTALTGTSVLMRGVLGTQTVGGLQKSWDKPVSAGMTNQDLVIYLGGAGTVDYTVSYFIKV